MTPRIPVIICNPDAVRPDHGTYYMVTREGLMMHVRNDWVDAVVHVKEFQALERVPVQASLQLPPIDAVVFAKALAFFRKIYELHLAESAVLLFYDKDKGWALSVPQQKVSAAYVKWRDPEAARMEGYRCMGSMHSHGYMSASHSHTDIADEAAIDGIHITIGNMSSYPEFSMAAELVVRGERFELTERMPEGVRNLAEELEHKESLPFMDRVRNAASRWSWRRVTYTHDPAVLAGWEVPADWLEKVECPGFQAELQRPRSAEEESEPETGSEPPMRGKVYPTRYGPEDLRPKSSSDTLLRLWNTALAWFGKKHKEFRKWKSNTQSS